MVSEDRHLEGSATRPRLQPLPRPRFTLPTIPTRRTRFFGRERERSDLLALLSDDSTRLIVLIGPGGIGKSRVALDVAASAPAALDLPAAFVALEAVTDPEILPSTIARALGIPERAGASSEQLLAEAIGGEQLLLVLDNLEQIVHSAPAIDRLLSRCPGLRVLATSRVRLGLPGEQLYPIAPLPVPADTGQVAVAALAENSAVALFVSAARLVRPDFAVTVETAAPIVAICRQLEGWPLALELAAARLAVLTPRDLLARLTPRLPLLRGEPERGPKHMRSMRETIAWSVRLLTDEERRNFERLAVFYDGGTLAAIEAVCADPEIGQSPLDALASLVDLSLLRIDNYYGAEARYRMLETILEYALEGLRESGTEREVRDRHAAWCEQFAYDGSRAIKSADGPRWLARFGAERANMRAALTWLDLSGQRARLLDLASQLATFWDYLGELSEGRRWLELALRDPDTLPQTSVSFAMATTWLGWFQHRQGDPESARPLLLAAIPLWQALGHTEGEGYAHSVLGVIGQIQGDVTAAREHFETARTLFAGVADLPGEIEATLNLSDLAYQIGERAEALTRAQQAHGLAETGEIRTYLAVAAVAVAQAELAAGNPAAALTAARSALDQARAIGFDVCAADALSGLAAIAAASLQDELAATLLGAAHERLAMTGSARFFFHFQFERTRTLLAARHGTSRLERAMRDGATLSDEAILRLVERVRAEAETSVPEARADYRVTPRERDVLRLLVAGKTDKEIANELFISHRTVNACVGRLLAKLDASSRTAAAAIAIREGLL